MEVQVPVNYFTDREVPREIIQTKLVDVNTIIESIHPVQLTPAERIVAISSTNTKTKELIKEVEIFVN